MTSLTELQSDLNPYWLNKPSQAIRSLCKTSWWSRSVALSRKLMQEDQTHHGVLACGELITFSSFSVRTVHLYESGAAVNRWERGWLQLNRDFAVSPTAFTAPTPRKICSAGTTCLAVIADSLMKSQPLHCCFQEFFLMSVSFSVNYFISATVISPW